MKKLSAIVLSLVMLLSLVSYSGFAEGELAEGDFYYTVIDGKAIITGNSIRYEYHVDKIDIPEQLGGYPVTAIGDEAFAYLESVTTITLPDTIEAIGNNAFIGCLVLEEITLPENLKTIGNYAFSDCDAFVEILIPESVVKIGEYAFYSCDSLEKINFNKSIISLDLCAFAQCNSITKLTIPASMMRIEKYALSSKNIKEITIEIYRGEKQEIPGSFIKTWYYEQAKPIIKFKTVNKKS